MLNLDWDSSYGSLYNYEEYPAKWCWLPPILRRGPFAQESGSCSEESPQLTILEEERERRLYECKVQEKRPFFQKRIYGCCNMRRWHFILIFSLLLLSFSGLVGGSIYFGLTIKNRMAEVKRLNMDIQEKQKQLDEKNEELEEKKREMAQKMDEIDLELKKKMKENAEKQRKIDEIDLELERKSKENKEMQQKFDQIDVEMKKKMKENAEMQLKMDEIDSELKKKKEEIEEKEIEEEEDEEEEDEEEDEEEEEGDDKEDSAPRSPSSASATVHAADAAQSSGAPVSRRQAVRKRSSGDVRQQNYRGCGGGRAGGKTQSQQLQWYHPYALTMI